MTIRPPCHWSRDWPGTAAALQAMLPHTQGDILFPHTQPGCSPVTLGPRNIQHRISKAGSAKSIASVPHAWGGCLAQSCFRERCFTHGSQWGGQQGSRVPCRPRGLQVLHVCACGACVTAVRRVHVPAPWKRERCWFTPQQAMD